MRTILCVLFLVASIGCGASASTTRATVIDDSYVAVEAATLAFEAFDRAHEAEIIAKATDLPSGTAQLTAWRAKVAPAQKALSVMWLAVKNAKKLNDDSSAAALLAAGLEVKQELAALGVTL